MAVNFTRLEELSQPVIDIYNEMQTAMLINIVKRLVGHEELLVDDTTTWQVFKLNQLGGLTQENIQLIAGIAGVGVRDLVNMLRETGIEALGANESFLEVAKRKGADLNQPPSVREDPTIRNILGAFQRQARDTLNLVNATMLEQSQQIYRDIINRTTAEVLAGIKTPQQALRSTIKQWARKGIPALIDRSGRQWSAEGYISMVTRTMGNRVANEMQEARFDAWGVDLVEVSSHGGARPRCAPYQGRIYSRSGSHSRYPSLSSTSIGHPAGLFGINCRHFRYPYFEGTRKTFHPYPQKENEEQYKQSQRQRYLERRIRAAKTELKAMEALGDEQGIKEARALVRRRQAEMRVFIEETGRTRRRDREQIYS